MRTGKVRLGTDQLLADERGQSRISAEDSAVALLDEMEYPEHARARFTSAYETDLRNIQTKRDE
jgi:putative NADH-flavin reductase